jgi:hypothetical protein
VRFMTLSRLSLGTTYESVFLNKAEIWEITNVVGSPKRATPCPCRNFVASLTLNPNAAWFIGQPEFPKIGDGLNNITVGVRVT